MNRRTGCFQFGSAECKFTLRHGKNLPRAEDSGFACAALPLSPLPGLKNVKSDRNFMPKTNNSNFYHPPHLSLSS